MSKVEREKYWSEKYDEYILSGLSSSQWCIRNNIPTSTFSKWKKIFSSKVTNMVMFAPVSIVKPIKKMQMNTSNFIKISIGKATIEFNDNTCQDTFSKAMEVLIKYV